MNQTNKTDPVIAVATVNPTSSKLLRHFKPWRTTQLTHAPFQRNSTATHFSNDRKQNAHLVLKFPNIYSANTAFFKRFDMYVLVEYETILFQLCCYTFVVLLVLLNNSISDLLQHIVNSNDKSSHLCTMLTRCFPEHGIVLSSVI